MESTRVNCRQVFCIAAPQWGEEFKVESTKKAELQLLRPDSLDRQPFSFSGPRGPLALTSGEAIGWSQISALSGESHLSSSLWELGSVSKACVDTAKTVYAFIKFINPSWHVIYSCDCFSPCALPDDMHVCSSPTGGDVEGQEGLVSCLPHLARQRGHSMRVVTVLVLIGVFPFQKLSPNNSRQTLAVTLARHWHLNVN